jgi:hypothetical protein
VAEAVLGLLVECDYEPAGKAVANAVVIWRTNSDARQHLQAGDDVG